MRERARGLGFLVASGAYLAAALAFPLGDVAKPGPGFFPLGVGVFLCLVAAASMIGRRPDAPAGSGVVSLSRDARVRVSATILGLVAFCLLLPWLGYPACAFLFIALLLRRLGGARWPGVVITAILGALVSYYVFGVLLGVPLPAGPF